LATVYVMVTVVFFFEFLVFTPPNMHSTDYSAAYYEEFNRAPTVSYNHSFSPPVSMYQALLIALETGGWTAATLQNMTIEVQLDCLQGHRG